MIDYNWPLVTFTGNKVTERSSDCWLHAAGFTLHEINISAQFDQIYRQRDYVALICNTDSVNCTIKYTAKRRATSQPSETGQRLKVVGIQKIR